ncbi:PFK2 [Brettanomyces bruxellensis]|uniref:ATP-dependent 6-phosphofructokinase n=1 Tax=Dekkera bruxellensis TaxID=5007 RepID=A0A7D9H224_DEKBR|nr:PFK2 [Brettanomyces bruxellensis]
MPEYLNDVPLVIYYAPNQEKFEQAVKFYEEVLEFEAVGSPEQGTVLLSSNPSSPAEAANIRLILDGSKAAPEEEIEKAAENFGSHKQKRDFRTLQSSVCFQTPDLDGLTEKLKAAGWEYQVRPSELDPFEVYVVDPLGTLVGFSGMKNAFGASERTRFNPEDGAKSYGFATSGEATPLNAISGATLNPVQRRRNIAVMTSGGDAPGMNANVRAIVRTAIFKGCRAFGIYEGYSGLVKGGPEYIREMNWHTVRDWLAEGGTNIGTARCMEFKEKWGRLRACKNMIDAGIDALIVCGGDGSLTGADRFRGEWPELISELLHKQEITQDQYDRYKHLNICGTVGSIDNDMATTDATIGAYSSLARICEAVDYINATANSHQRAFVVEVMGRHCGWLALMAGIATAADWIFIPEKPSSRSEWSSHMCEIVAKHRARGKRTTIVIVAEGAIDASLNPITPDDVKDVLVDKLGLDTRVTTLGHVQRGGPAVAYDRELATLQGVAAVEAILDGTPETPSPMIAIAENKIVRRPLMEAVKLTKSVAQAIADKDFAKAISLRDTEFTEHLRNFMAMNSADFDEPSLPASQRKRFAIINVGAPAGGMNSAVYSFATYCMSRGHVPYAIHNGFSGLARHDSVRSLNWLDIQGLLTTGGSEIGTNRTTPEEADLGMIAYYFDKYSFDGLILVGGFEAFTALSQLERARAHYPAFRIPMVLVPATLSNNVPGTQYSLGSDTCLNSLVDYCDAIKQSAAATRKRCFVVECMGGNCGYISTYTQLTTGAVASYSPEDGIPIEQFEQDIDTLKTSFNNDKGKEKSGRLLIKSARASDVMSAKVMAQIITSEAHGRFDARTAVPGHIQQGGVPSPIDRTRAARFAIRAVTFLEDHYDEIASSQDQLGEFIESPTASNTACVLGIQSSHVKFESIRKLYDYESESGKRSRKRIFWKDIHEIADMLSGRVVV